MTSDDQFFFDYLASIPHDVRRYSMQVADSIDRQIDCAATSLRDTFSNQSWVPSAIRPVSKKRPQVQTSHSLTARVQDWALQNRAWSAAVLAFVGTGCVLYFGNKKLNGRKRKARRAGNGARKEIVVVAGSPHEPMTRSISCDLERRGYVVFVTVSSAEEDHIVQSENRTDIRPLWIDLTTEPPSPTDIHPSLRGIRSLITHPQSPMPGVPPHTSQLSGLVVIPSSHYMTGPVATIPQSTWADTVNTRILSPVLLTQLFLPLLTLRSNPSNIVFVYPSISSSLSAPFASPEVVTTRALSGFATSLRTELSLLQQGNVSVVEVRVGNVDLSAFSRHGHGHGRMAGTEVLTWSPQQRALYGPQYLSSIEQRPVASAGPASVRGSPARHLHHAVLDALEPPSKSILGGRSRKTPVIYAGRGAWTYGQIGVWAPGGLVGWMLGLRSGYGPVMDHSSNSTEASWEKV